MNEKHIRQVLEIERQAREIHEAAVREAQNQPLMAEQEAQALIAKARAEAQEEARRLLANAQSEEEVNKILAQAEESNREFEALAMTNFDRAVNYVLDRVIGRE